MMFRVFICVCFLHSLLSHISFCQDNTIDSLLARKKKQLTYYRIINSVKEWLYVLNASTIRHCSKSNIPDRKSIIVCNFNVFWCFFPIIQHIHPRYMTVLFIALFHYSVTSYIPCDLILLPITLPLYIPDELVLASNVV